MECGIVGFGICNTAQGIRNPESGIRLTIGLQNPESSVELEAWNS